MASISSITSHTLDLPPSCIAFCPTRPEYFVVGTYHLHQTPYREGEEPSTTASDGAAEAQHEDQDGTQKRSGSLILYQLRGEELIQIATESTPDYSILDIQWSSHRVAHGELLAVATSTGLVVIYELIANTSVSRLVEIATQRICQPSILVLSLAWHPSRPDCIGVTLSDGRVCLCRSTDGQRWSSGAPVDVVLLYKHSLEAWTLAFHGHHSVFSGGDDMMLQRAVPTGDAKSSSLWEDRRLHGAGVTAILPLTDEVILTGSYDDHIRLVSAPAVGRRQVLAEANLGGGVWRLKVLHDSGEQGAPAASASASASSALSASTRSLIILASCMHTGTRIVRLSGSENLGDWGFEILAKFEEHKSMNYGSDAQPGTCSVKRIVSTSFYDKLMCLWRCDAGAEER